MKRKHTPFPKERYEDPNKFREIERRFDNDKALPIENMAWLIGRVKVLGRKLANVQFELSEEKKLSGRDKDHVELPDAVQQNLRLLKQNLDRLEQQMNPLVGPDGVLGGSRNLPPAHERLYNDEHGKAAMALARALSALSKEVRGLEREAKDAARDMSLAQKRALMVEFFANLPQELQNDTLEQLLRIAGYDPRKGNGDARQDEARRDDAGGDEPAPF